jgi:hypothetical protein
MSPLSFAASVKEALSQIWIRCAFSEARPCFVARVRVHFLTRPVDFTLFFFGMMDAVRSCSPSSCRKVVPVSSLLLL